MRYPIANEMYNTANEMYNHANEMYKCKRLFLQHL